MISNLPSSKSPKSGFTLVELLVVIAIISVLATMGYAVYAGAVASSRDAKRRTEITQIAKAIETVKNPLNGTYSYNTAAGLSDFPKGFPVDQTAGVNYCIFTSTTTAPPAVPAATWVSGCPALPSGYTALNTSMSTNATNNLGYATPDVKAWTLCAALERGSTFYCVSSLTQ